MLKKTYKKKRYLHSSNICTTQTNICTQGEKKRKKKRVIQWLVQCNKRKQYKKIL